MKDFKNLIREAHLGNPLNEVNNSNIQAENILKKLFGKKLDPSVIAILVDEINDIIKKKPSIKDNPEEIARELAKDSDIDPKLLLKPRMGFIREEPLNEEFSSTEQKMIKQIQSYKKRGSAMVTLPSKVRDFYFKNKEKIDALNENMGEWPKELTSRYSDEYRFELEKVMSDRAKYRVIDIESGELKGTPVFEKPESLMAYADDLIKPQGGTQSSHFGTNEGTCGYGEDGKIGKIPAGPHLNEVESGDVVTYKGKDHTVQRIEDDDLGVRVYIRPNEKSYYGGRKDTFWVKPEDLKEDVQPLVVKELTDEALVNLLNNLDDDTGKFTRAKSELMKAAGDEVKRRGLRVHYVDNDRYEFMKTIYHCDHVLSSKTHYMFCETVQEAEVVEYL